MLTFLPYLAGFVLGGVIGYLAGSTAGGIRLKRAYEDNAKEWQKHQFVGRSPSSHRKGQAMSQSDTPLTDSAAYHVVTYGDEYEVVDADLARRLERDRAALLAVAEEVLNSANIYTPQPLFKMAEAALAKAQEPI